VLVRTGIGPDRARKTLKGLVLPGSVAAVCSIGYAGALKDEIHVGDLLIPSELLFLAGANPSRFEPDGFLFNHACDTARRGEWRFHSERMLTSDRVVPTEQEKRDLGLRWQAGSVEMESSVAARIAFEAGVPFVAVRVALDELSFSLPDVSGFLRLCKGGQWGSAAAWIIKDPSRFVALARLWRYSHLGSTRLAAFLERFLDRGGS